jgi:hypothetical protein
MKESKPLYGFYDHEDFSGIVWDTELGKVVTCSGLLNPQMNLSIRDIKTGDEVDNVDLRNVLISILPRKLISE